MAWWKTTSFSKAKEMEMKKKEEMIEAEASQGGELWCELWSMGYTALSLYKTKTLITIGTGDRSSLYEWGGEILSIYKIID